ncbi:unnamed protein product [Parnassius apollo]|uniref:(apollo) hypothetical protein n=1 Tax=Parnassius apollo TaxID=110799 RepID=A0A8S3WRV0_PARAO|nr:unnamed protein product [Parnassius apollo]
MSKCAACGKFVSPADIIKCSSCANIYDRICLKLSKSYKVSPKWLCPGCTSKQPRKDNTETPIKVQTEISQSSSSNSSPSSCSGCDATSKMIEELRTEIVAMRNEFVNFGTNFDRLYLAVSDLSKRVDGIENRVANLEKDECMEKYKDENKKLSDTLERLKFELNDRDQEQLLTDVEISCIPEHKGENVTQLAMLIGEKLNVKMEEQDIVSIQRMSPLRGYIEEEGAVQPRPLAVRLARRTLRDRLLQSARVRRGADTTGFGLPGSPKKFYINEHLTRINRQLFFKARQMGSKSGWKYVWTRDGRIYARRDRNTEARRIRCEIDLVKFFGEPVVG